MTATRWALWRDRMLVALAGIALLWVAGNLLSHVLRILVLALLAILLAFALNPGLSFAERHMPRVVAALTLYVTVALLLGGGAYLVAPSLANQGAGLASSLPVYQHEIQGIYDRLAGQFGLPSLSLGQFQSALDPRGLLGTALGFASTVGQGILDLVLVLVLAFYFMVDGARMRAALLAIVPSSQRDRAKFAEAAAGQVLGAYIRGQLVMALIIGVSAGVGCLLLGVHYPVVIGVMAFLAELVPMLGPFLAALPAVLISAFQPFPLVLWVIVFFIVMQMLESNVLGPRITGHAVGLHPVAAMLSLLVGAELFGIIGALFAVPVVGVLVVLASAALKTWRGEPVVFDRGPVKLRLPRRRRRPQTD